MKHWLLNVTISTGKHWCELCVLTVFWFQKSQHTLNTKLFNFSHYQNNLPQFDLFLFRLLFRAWNLVLVLMLFFASDPKNRKEKMKKIKSKQNNIFCHFMVGVFPQEIFISFVFLLFCCWRYFSINLNFQNKNSNKLECSKIMGESYACSVFNP